jgi:hypothetical protein
VTFPLFQADLRLAERGEPDRLCSLCGARAYCLPLDRRSKVDVRVAVPPSPGLRGCLDCLRDGRFLQHHDTETGAETAELVHTPRYATFQGERWLFCHDEPMTYLGEWARDDFERERPGAGRDLFLEIIRDVGPDQVEAAWQHGFDSGLTVYVFRCRRCEKLRTHSDVG